MEGWIAHEATLRYYVLVVSFGVVAVAEALAPRRVPVPPARGRWALNIGLTVLLSVIVGLLFPLLSVGVALAAERMAWGAFNRVAAPDWLEFTLAVLALDAGRYGMHVLLHRNRLLWRLHRVHHSDMHFDCTTALRFHPLEAMITVGAHLALVVALGAPVLAVLVYETVSSFMSLFSHGNLALPPRLDALMRSVLVTPDIHRIHHSSKAVESNANFGNILPWWDRLCGTYRAEPQGGVNAMTIGLATVRDSRTSSVAWLLAWPFRRGDPTAG